MPWHRPSLIAYHRFLFISGSLARFISSASWPILRIHRSTSCFVSSLALARSRSATSNCRLSTASSSCTSATNLFFCRNSSSRSRSRTARCLRSVPSVRSVRASSAVRARRRASSSSAALRRDWSCPLERRASASSRRVWGEAVVLGSSLVGALAGARSAGGCLAAFSASRTATRSASWEPRVASD